jgi:cytochrome c-type biogenesis protein CcmH
MPPAPLFWLVALLLAAASVAAIVWPLLRSRVPSAIADDAAATDVYRDQKRQLDEELLAGAITRTERDAQLDELATRLSGELAVPSPAVTRGSPRASYVAALILVAAIPVAALALYAAFGSPAALRAEADAAKPKMSDQEIAALVDKLATRMKEHPEDPAGWQLLARTYAALGRFDDAVAAYKEAAARGTPDAALYADWADSLAMRTQSLQGEPSRLIDKALALDPSYPKALALAATAALERKDYAQAIADWRKLKTQFQPGSEEAKSIDSMIVEADAAQRGGAQNSAPIAGAQAATPEEKVNPAAAAAPAPSGEKIASIEATAITGSVSIDPKLRERVAPNDALFVFARAPTGPRMPLAVVRTTAADLPYAFRLDDTMAMAPIAKLSNADQVVVEARISRSGSATPAPGDLEGKSAPVKPGARDVLIVINDVVR